MKIKWIWFSSAQYLRYRFSLLTENYEEDGSILKFRPNTIFHLKKAFFVYKINSLALQESNVKIMLRKQGKKYWIDFSHPFIKNNEK